jgi:hypothetical protein
MLNLLSKLSKIQIWSAKKKHKIVLNMYNICLKSLNLLKKINCTKNDHLLNSNMLNWNQTANLFASIQTGKNKTSC